MFFNLKNVLELDFFLNFCVSDRGAGKTYSSLKFLADNYLETGEQFIYLRRSKIELEKACASLFDAHKTDGLYPEHTFTMSNDNIMCSNKVMGYSIALSTAYQLKSTAFPRVKYILFDEFIAENGKYLKEEVTKFLSAIETIGRMRDIKIICLANQSTIYNPYYLYFKVKPHSKTTKFTRFNEQKILIHQFIGEEYRKAKIETDFAKLIKDTKYGSFLLNNENINDDYSYVDQLKGIKKAPIRNLIIEGKNIVVYEAYFDDKYYLYFETRNKIEDLDTINYDKHLREDSSIESIRSHPLSKRITVNLKRGNVRFKDVPTKNLLQDFIF